MSALAHQLRLLRDSLRDIPEVPAPAIALLNDLLVRQRGLPVPADGSVAAERAYWQAYSAAVAAEAAPAVTAVADELDTAALQAWLRELPGEAAVRVLEARTVSRGFSKKTVLVRLAQNAVLPEEIALRIDQKFNYLGTTVVDEYPWLTRLWDHGARIAQPFALEASGGVLGQPFLVSAKVAGGAVGGNYVPPPRNDALVADVAAALAGIHAVPLGDLGGRPGAHIATEIDAYETDWRALGETSQAVEAGFTWVRRHIAAAHGPEAIVHNDYNFNNMMVEGDRLLAVVDWEFAHRGNPAADLGYFYYSAESVASFGFFLERYAAAGGQVPPPEALEFYIFWGQLRLAIMGFQAVNGLQGGNFKDIRFAASLGHLRSGMLRVTERLEGLLKQEVAFLKKSSAKNFC